MRNRAAECTARKRASCTQLPAYVASQCCLHTTAGCTAGSEASCATGRIAACKHCNTDGCRAGCTKIGYKGNDRLLQHTHAHAHIRARRIPLTQLSRCTTRSLHSSFERHCCKEPAQLSPSLSLHGQMDGKSESWLQRSQRGRRYSRPEQSRDIPFPLSAGQRFRYLWDE